MEVRRPAKSVKSVSSITETSQVDSPARTVQSSKLPRSHALEMSIGYSLRRAQYSTYDEFTDAMRPFDIRPSQFAVLVLIRSSPGITQSAVCQELSIQKTNLVGLLDKLEQRGLTERRKVRGDRRSSALHLTPSGDVFVAALERSHSQLEQRLIKRLGLKRSQDLLAALHDFTAKAL